MSDQQDVFDQMAAAIMDSKRGREREPVRLTPVVGETTTQSITPQVVIMPSNPAVKPVTAQDLRDVLDLWKVAQRAEENANRALTGLYWRLMGEPPQPLNEAEVVAEVEVVPSRPAPPPAPVAVNRWSCPKHEVFGEERTGASGRVYYACPFPGCKKQGT